MAIAPLPLAACLKYAELQTAAEAFLVDERNGKIREGPRQALIDGNRRGTRFTRLRAAEFAEHWIALDQTAAPATDFGGTLFKCIRDDPATGAMAGELVMSFRGTEFIGNAAHGDDAISASQLNTIGSAWDRVCDMEAWYQSLRNRRLLQPGQDFAVTGYGLGGHLATIFSLLHGPTAPAADRAAIRLVVTFSGAGASGFDDGTGPDTRCLAPFGKHGLGLDLALAQTRRARAVAASPDKQTQAQQDCGQPGAAWDRCSHRALLH